MWLAWVRTFIFYAFFYGPFTIFWAIFAGLTSWILPKTWRYPYIILTWSWFSLYAARWVLGIRWQVVGLEHLPKETVVIAANHQSAWETFFLQVLINPQSQVIKQSLLRIPFFGWTYRLVRPIAIDRSDKKSAMSQVIEQGTKVLAEGIHVLIFPEGTRRNPDQLGRFSKGAAMLAKAANVPVLPVSLDAGRFWPASLKQPKMPGTITVTLHPLVVAKDRDATTVTHELEAHIKGALLHSSVTNEDVSLSTVEPEAR
ncbi:lysophospholipid acyltransferase family protein [Salinispirillum marinum]|uniref:Lysophospholipid acyltransferase family protein n=2 Tax=Saccharospirillaceae TaxID=255527 RepID=A0ABV8BBM1_9GAMM